MLRAKHNIIQKNNKIEQLLQSIAAFIDSGFQFIHKGCKIDSIRGPLQEQTAIHEISSPQSGTHSLNYETIMNDQTSPSKIRGSASGQ